MIFTDTEEDLNKLVALQRDADRYRFLRNEDNWGANNPAVGWNILTGATGYAFDAIVDERMEMMED